jgi:hypothetical protein
VTPSVYAAIADVPRNEEAGVRRSRHIRIACHQRIALRRAGERRFCAALAAVGIEDLEFDSVAVAEGNRCLVGAREQAIGKARQADIFLVTVDKGVDQELRSELQGHGKALLSASHAGFRSQAVVRRG